MFCTLVFTFRASAMALPPSDPSMVVLRLQNDNNQCTKKISKNDPRQIRFRIVDSEEN
jgi:hypothetical protein